jgi:sugar lactone lactonase YvrE
MKKSLLFVTGLLVAALLPLTVYAAAGDLYESDINTGTIFQFTPSGTQLTFATGLTGVRGLAFDRAGNLYAGQDTKIVRITPQGFITTLASGLHGPNFLTVDRDGNIYATDRDGNVLRFTPQGVESIFAFGLNKPTGLAFDFDGNLFVADYAANTVYKFTPSGSRTIFVTNLHGPQGVAFDRNGNLFVANAITGTIDRFTPLGSKTTPITGLDSPDGIVLDPAGNLFVAEDCNGNANDIKEFTGATGAGAVFASNLGCPLQLAIEPPRDLLLNISTRAHVETGQNRELIGGFIVTPTEPKKVLIRAIGPSLTKSGVVSPLPDPTLELHLPNGSTVSNDNWMDSQKAEIQATGLAPNDPHESAILITLDPGSYTAIVRGQPPIQDGIAVVDVFDLDLTVNSSLANISSRGFVETGDDVMIAGFVVGGDNGAGKVIIRALGPSLTQSGITRVLPDPTLSLKDANGATLQTNDDWGDTQKAEIQSTGLAPQSTLESAIVAYLPAGSYTAIVQDVKVTNTGVALVEVFNLK